jgi:enterochelin esterase-like enzyme
MTEWRSFRSAALGETVRYAVVRGDGDGPLPVVYLLHGRGDSAASWEPVLGELRRLPSIAIMPDAPWSARASYYVDSLHRSGRAVETALSRDLVAEVDARFPTIVDRTGRLVAGYSMGGYGAVRLALAHPATFSAAVVLSPAVYVPEPPEGSSAREFGAFGRGAARYDPERYRELAYPGLLAAHPAHHDLRLAVAVGDTEAAHPGAPSGLALAAQAQALAEAAGRTPGIRSSFRTYPGGHDFGVWRPALLGALQDLRLTLT